MDRKERLRSYVPSGKKGGTRMLEVTGTRYLVVYFTMRGQSRYTR